MSVRKSILDHFKKIIEGLNPAECLELQKTLEYYRGFRRPYIFDFFEDVRNIEVNLRKGRKKISKLISIDDFTSIDIDNIESIVNVKNAFIAITMKSGAKFELGYTEKDWLKLHKLKT